MALRTLSARAPLANFFFDALFDALLDLRDNLHATVARRAVVMVRALAVAIPVVVVSAMVVVAVAVLPQLQEAVEHVSQLDDARPREFDVVAAHADLEVVPRERQEIDGAVLASLELREAGEGVGEAGAMVLFGHGFLSGCA
jgi:hypothetical protein